MGDVIAARTARRVLSIHVHRDNARRALLPLDLAIRMADSRDFLTQTFTKIGFQSHLPF